VQGVDPELLTELMGASGGLVQRVELAAQVVPTQPPRIGARVAQEASMSCYRDQVLPRIVNRLGGMSTVGPLRQRACSGLAGTVVEIGFGSGLNVPFYPADVTAVAAVEPSDVAWRLAGRRLVGSEVPVVRAGVDGQSLPLPDGTFDAALSTWTLCTIPDAAAALAEVRRVLRPGGTIHFVEHGLAPDLSVQRWQRRLEPLQKRVFGGCHLTRRPVEMLQEAGFTVTELDVFYEERAPKALAADSLGVARRD
jgi:SAM-dependent methyltransferase